MGNPTLFLASAINQAPQFSFDRISQVIFGGLPGSQDDLHGYQHQVIAMPLR
jgi:hypothetical protein